MTYNAADPAKRHYPMIRRDVTNADGTPCWSLISQVEHARLSGELARDWGNEKFPPVICVAGTSQSHELLAVREEVLAAIAHHDDGWREWEAAPKLDPVHRRPYSFMEMPLADSLAIWKKSIMSSTAIGPLAAWMVAGHFIELRNNSDTQSAEARRWVDEMVTLRSRWLAAWQAINPELHTQQLAEQALLWLRWFDVLSLWLCIAVDEPLHVPPDLQTECLRVVAIEFSWLAPGKTLDSSNASARPWPFCSAFLELTADAIVIPVNDHRQGDRFVHDTSSHRCHHWRIIPSAE